MPGHITKIQSTYWNFMHNGAGYKINFSRFAVKKLDHRKRDFHEFYFGSLPPLGFMNSTDWVRYFLYVRDPFLLVRVCHEVDVVVREAFAGWPKSDYYFNENFSLTDVVGSGGEFFKGPIEVAEKIKERISFFGVSGTLIPCQGRRYPEPNSKALVIDSGSAYIISEAELTLERLF